MYCAALPLWEGFDEYSHFALIQHLALEHRVPQLREHVSREIRESLLLAPVPWIIRTQDPRFLTHDSYWQLPDTARDERRRALATLPASLKRQPGDGDFHLYESQQAPLYYRLLMPVYLAVDHLQLPTRVAILRFLTALMASAAIPAAFFAAELAFASTTAAATVAVLLACFPQLLLSVCRVGNEGLSIGTGAVAAWMILRCLLRPAGTRQGALAGLALAAALLSKAYFLALLPAAIVALIAARRRPQLLAALTTTFILAAWWYVRTWLATGSITGEQNDVAAQQSSLTLGQAIAHLDWARAFDFLVTSHIWLGNWSFLVVRSWMYRIIELLLLTGFIGAALQLACPRPELPARRTLIVLWLLWLAPLAGIVYHTIVGFRSIGASSSLGYYLYAFAVPECILLITGWRRLSPQRLEPLLATALLALEAYATWLLMLPYYAGLTRHNAAGALKAYPLTNYRPGTLTTLATRLGASTTSPSILAVLIAAFGLATLFLLAAPLWNRPPRDRALN